MQSEHKKIIWGILLVLILVAAYVFYTRAPGEAPGDSILEDYSTSNEASSVDPQTLQSYTAPTGSEPTAIAPNVLDNYSTPQ